MKDYELRINYITGQLTRSWLRFYWFFAFTAALTVTYFRIPLESSHLPSIGLCLVGIGNSVIWYILGAQDKYVIEVYRTAAANCAEKIADLLHWNKRYTAPYLPVGVSDTNPTGYALDWRRLFEWRASKVSTTNILALFPIGSGIYWLVLISIDLVA